MRRPSAREPARHGRTRCRRQAGPARPPPPQALRHRQPVRPGRPPTSLPAPIPRPARPPRPRPTVRFGQRHAGPGQVPRPPGWSGPGTAAADWAGTRHAPPPDWTGPRHRRRQAGPARAPLAGPAPRHRRRRPDPPPPGAAPAAPPGAAPGAAPPARPAAGSAPAWSTCRRCPASTRPARCCPTRRSPRRSGSAAAAASRSAAAADGRPGRPRASARSDGTPFSFTPKLHPGDLVGRPVRGAGLPRARRARLDLPGPGPQRRRPLGGAQGPARHRRRGRDGRRGRRAAVPRPGRATRTSSRSTTSCSTRARTAPRSATS